jgi:hypothetical protein
MAAQEVIYLHSIKRLFLLVMVMHGGTTHSQSMRQWPQHGIWSRPRGRWHAHWHPAGVSVRHESSKP